MIGVLEIVWQADLNPAAGFDKMRNVSQQIVNSERANTRVFQLSDSNGYISHCTLHRSLFDALIVMHHNVVHELAYRKLLAGC